MKVPAGSIFTETKTDEKHYAIPYICKNCGRKTTLIIPKRTRVEDYIITTAGLRCEYCECKLR